MTNKKWNIKKFEIALLILITMILSLELSACGLEIRRATLEDLDGTWIGNTVTITPKENIKNLEMRFVLRDSSLNELEAISKRFGNVKKGKEYTFTIESDALEQNIHPMIQVTGGTITKLLIL